MRQVVVWSAVQVSLIEMGGVRVIQMREVIVEHIVIVRMRTVAMPEIRVVPVIHIRVDKI